MNYSELTTQVVISSIATVGLIEVFKNFFNTKRKWIYSLIMIPLSIGTYFATVCLPVWVIGGILTVGVTQECYQVIIQSVQSVVHSVTNKMGGENKPKEEENGNESKAN